MTKDELITQAKRMDAEQMFRALDGGEDGILAALETFYGHGFPDDQLGDADGPVGHVYRVDRWLVSTDEHGNHDVQEYDTEAAAVEMMDNLRLVKT